LLLGALERSRVIDYEVGSFDFFFVGNLRRHAAGYFGTGGVFRNSKAAGETLNALFGMAGHDDQSIEAIGGMSFEDQGSFNDGDGIRIPASDFFHPPVFVLDNRGMNNFIQLLHSRSRTAGVAERGFGQPGTVNVPIGIQDSTAEAAHNLLIHCVAAFHERMGDRIGLDQVRAAFYKHLADGGFAARDAASEADF